MNDMKITRRDFMKKAALLASAGSFSLMGLSSEHAAAGTSGSSTLSATAGPMVDALLENGVIIDVRTGKLIHNKTILIKNGKILDMINSGSGGGIQAGACHDLGGGYVLPGLINAHTHMSMPCSISFFDPHVLPHVLPLMYKQSRKNALECVRHGVTTVRDMGCMYNICRKLQDHIEAGGIIGPRIIASSVLDITGSFMSAAFGLSVDPHTPYFQPANSSKQAVKAVDHARKHGLGWIKLYHQKKNMGKPLPHFLIMSDPLAKAVCDEARRQGMPVAQHATDSTGLAKGMVAGVTTFEHMVIDRELTGDEINRIIDADISFIPTASVGYALCYRTRNDPDWSTGIRKWIADERNRLLPDMIDEYLLPEYAAAMHTTFANYLDPDYFDTYNANEPIKLDPDAFLGAMTNGMSNIAAIYDAGVRIGCGNDGGMPFLFPGALGLEMHLLQKDGYDPADVLKMATLNNAEILGLDTDLGTVEKGKIADLAVFAGNPLETLEHAFEASHVFQAGKLVHS